MIELDGIEVKVGDKLYDLLFGWVVVAFIDENDIYEPLRVMSNKWGTRRFYSDGKIAHDYMTRTLYWGCPLIIPPVVGTQQPIKVADWVIYKGNGNHAETLLCADEKRVGERLKGLDEGYSNTNIKYYARQVNGTERIILL